MVKAVECGQHMLIILLTVFQKVAQLDFLTPGILLRIVGIPTICIKVAEVGAGIIIAIPGDKTPAFQYKQVKALGFDMGGSVGTVAVNRVVCYLMIGEKPAHTTALRKYTGTFFFCANAEGVLLAGTYGHKISVRDTELAGNTVIYVKLVFHEKAT